MKVFNVFISLIVGFFWTVTAVDFGFPLWFALVFSGIPTYAGTWISFEMVRHGIEILYR